MAKPIIGMIPPSGWHFIDGDARLNAGTYDKLLQVVENYRAENHLPSGDVEGDVNSFICGNWPTFCHGVDMVSITSVNAPTRTSELMNDIQTWAKNILMSTKRLPLVTDDLAEQRAKTCRSCPQNINWRAGCGSCINATDRLCANVRQARDTASTAVLGGCMKLRHDNRTAVFIDRDELQLTTDLPDNCWLNA